MRAGRRGLRLSRLRGQRLRASVTGARRTAEELGRAFPGVPVRTSGRDEVLDVVPGDAAVVVATPGAEPIAEGGYGAVLLLDTWALLTRADLRAAEETMRRWLSAAALARPASAGDGSWWWPTVRWRRCRRWCAGTRAGSRPGSSPSGVSWASRPRPGSRA
ncbi:hypothetical protein Asp14428_72330 [Actinoplanes sp. NBRC 14428]|nr:hypothetical protein Asp14428_72330 [Actinoplanes sp. NBRC 14428]